MHRFIYRKNENVKKHLGINFFLIISHFTSFGTTVCLYLNSHNINGLLNEFKHISALSL